MPDMEYIQAPPVIDVKVGTVVKINPCLPWGKSNVKMKAGDHSYNILLGKLFAGERVISSTDHLNIHRVELHGGEFYTRNMLLVKGVDYE